MNLRGLWVLVPTTGAGQGHWVLLLERLRRPTAAVTHISYVPYCTRRLQSWSAGGEEQDWATYAVDVHLRAVCVQVGVGKGRAFSLRRPVWLDGCVVSVHRRSRQEWVLSLSTACTWGQGSAAAWHPWGWDRRRPPGSQCPSGSATSNTDKVFLLPKPISTTNFDRFLAALVNYLPFVFTPNSLLPAALCARDSVICDLLTALQRSLILSFKSLSKLPYFLSVLSSLPFLFSF